MPLRRTIERTATTVTQTQLGPPRTPKASGLEMHEFSVLHDFGAYPRQAYALYIQLLRLGRFFALKDLNRPCAVHAFWINVNYLEI